MTFKDFEGDEFNICCYCKMKRNDYFEYICSNEDCLGINPYYTQNVWKYNDDIPIQFDRKDFIKDLVSEYTIDDEFEFTSDTRYKPKRERELKKKSPKGGKSGRGTRSLRCDKFKSY